MTQNGGQNSAKETSLSIRDATIDDMDTLFRMMRDSMAEDPIVNYRYPLRHEYPADYEKYRRAELDGYLNQPEKFKVQIAADDNGPAAFAVWDVAPTIKANDTENGRETRKDINPKNFDFFIKRIIECVNKYFVPYGDNQLSLRILGTLPSQRRRGAGSLLVRWGIANANGRPITLFSSLQGRFLYEHLGFDWIADEEFQADDDEEKLTLAVMEHRP